jgi:hypothetical protein
MFPLFGDFKRRTTTEQANQITSVILRPVPGETKPFYLRITDECPWKFVRDPVQVAAQIKKEDPEADVTGITANCAVMEQSCSMDQLNKVVLVLLEDVIVKEGDPPVELLCTYNITKLRTGWKAHVPSTRPPRTTKKPAGSSDDETEESTKEHMVAKQPEGSSDAEVGETPKSLAVNNQRKQTKRGKSSSKPRNPKKKYRRLIQAQNSSASDEGDSGDASADPSASDNEDEDYDDE